MGTSQYTRLQLLCDVSEPAANILGRDTALILGAANGHTSMIKQLIAAGAGLDVKDNDGYEPIYPTATAVRYPSRQPIRRCRFVGRGTALMVAAEKGHTLVIEQLIAAGAGLDVKENNG